jgi:pyruvate/2-oxoglutarate dehydrogenase complex dihydrolipoamide acyltransferase (E2) component
MAEEGRRLDSAVEIETDKAQMDFEFQEDGTLAKVLRDSGEKDVAVGSVSQIRLRIWDFV